MSGDTDINNDHPEAVEVAPMPSDQSRFPLRPLIFGLVGLLAVVGLVIGVVSTGDDGDDTGADVDVAVDEPADEPAAPVDSDESREGGDDPVDRTAADLPAAEGSYYGGGDWLVPWGEGFLEIGLIFHPAPLPEFDDRFSDLFPPEVRETIESVGATTVEDAMDALFEAGLMAEVEEIASANPEMMDWFYGAEPPPPTLEIRESADGTDWTLLDDVTIPGGESLMGVASDGEHLVVTTQTWHFDEGEEYGPGRTEMWVATTTDLVEWQVHEIPSADPAKVPSHVFVESNIATAAVGPDGWLVSTHTFAWLDEWSLLPQDLQEYAGGWETTADETGVTFDLYEIHEPEFVTDEEGQVLEEIWPEDEECCEIVETRVLTWDELGTDYETWQQYREGENSTTATWTAPWGSDPVETVLSDAYMGFGPVVGTEAGFVALTWNDETVGNTVLFSVDGRSWNERPSPLSGAEGWVDSLVAVEGGVLATGSDGVSQMVWTGDADGSNWQPTDIPGLDPDVWVGFWSSSSSPGAATIVDQQDYSIYDPPAVDVEVTYEHEGLLITAAQSSDGGSSILVTDAATGEVVLDATSELAYPGELPEFAVFREAGLDIVDPATGATVVTLPADEVMSRYEQAYDVAVAETGWTPPDEFDLQPDLWILASADGLSWLLEDLDEGSEPWPQQAAINGDTVVVRVADEWSVFALT